jgi:GntR family transcriptional regulator, transcriptional repressor for pyruvate dehydrogenase complex
MNASMQPFAEFSRRDCFEFRIGIEGEAAATAARNRSLSHLDELRALMARLDDVRLAGSPGLNEDFAFHLAVARASGNAYFVSVLESLRDAIFEGMLLARTATGLRVEEKLAAISEQHRDVYDAILARDEDGARQAMRNHLLRCKQSTSQWDIYSAH